MEARLQTAFDRIHPGWKKIFTSTSTELKIALAKTIFEENITPNIEDIFNAFIVDPQQIQVIIIGQDPYPRDGDAYGFSFAMSPISKALPASLRNILSAVFDSKELPPNFDTSLMNWVTQGVLLLNASLTTIIGKSKVHSNYWHLWVSKIIKQLIITFQGIHFFLWGQDAQQMVPPGIEPKHQIHTWTHPSPLADNKIAEEKRFINCNHFNATKNINWNYSPDCIEVYTDGAVELHKKASYGIYWKNASVSISGRVLPQLYELTESGKKIVAKPDTSKEPTSQRGEYLAMCYALLLVKEHFLIANSKRKKVIITDSANTKGILTEWTKKPTEKYGNSDLVTIMRNIYAELKDSIEIHHVLSHNKDSKNPYNEGNNMADKLASMALEFEDFKPRINSKININILC